jgi:hypothetical protein
MRRALVSTLAGPLPIADRLLTQPRFGIMVRQQFGLALRGLRKALHQFDSNAPVDLLPGALKS